MSKYHGIVFAYGSDAGLGELVGARCAASLPFCGRYRLIDFSLSAMMNAGIHDVGVIMQRDYQSLLDHLGSGKDWDMGRRIGGLKILPPFGLPEYHRGDYSGTIEALNAVKTYVRDVREDYIVLMQGDLAANIDLSAAIKTHEDSGAEITAICTGLTPAYMHHRYIVDSDGFARRMIFNQTEAGEGLASLEAYIISKPLLLQMMDACAAARHYYFHRDAICDHLAAGGRVCIYEHKGFAKRIRSTEGYFRASMDMLDPGIRSEMFPPERPVRTKTREDVSTYYGEDSKVKNCLVSDGCIIEGEAVNSIIFSDVRIARGASLNNCIVMRGCEVGENARLTCVIGDKYTSFSDGTVLIGSDRLPIVVPKRKKI